MRDERILEAIRSAYRNHGPADRFERRIKRLRERLFGVDLRIFDRTIRFYREVHGLTITPREALARALDKEAHKVAWFRAPRETLQDKMAFYGEVHVYPFRQPYNKRFGGFRWYAALVRHIPRPSVLEYGCGSAVLTEYLLARFPHFRYTVADIPSVTLDFVRWKQRTYGLPYRILTIGPGREGIPLDEPYDLIICQDVLEHTPNPLEIATAFTEHLAPLGVLVVDFLNAPGGENLPEAAAQREAVKRLLAERLIPLKAIDEPSGNDGLYVRPAD